MMLRVPAAEPIGLPAGTATSLAETLFGVALTT